MRTIQVSGATGAPPISSEALQRSRVLARFGLSPAVADVVASTAFGACKRDDVTTLHLTTSTRCAMAGEVRS